MCSSDLLYRKSYEFSNSSVPPDPSIVNDISSDFGELGDSDITSLLNYTLHSVQNSSQFHDQAKKHAIVLTHRNPHWIEQVAKKCKDSRIQLNKRKLCSQKCVQTSVSGSTSESLRKYKPDFKVLQEETGKFDLFAIMSINLSCNSTQVRGVLVHCQN